MLAAGRGLAALRTLRAMRVVVDAVVSTVEDLTFCKGNLRSIFGESLVGVAVQPMLARLRRGNHRMSTGVRVFAGVLIRGAVAAERDSTRLARSEMHPIGPNLHAFFASAPVRLLDRLNRNRIQMSTTSDIHNRLT
jgi:hypothetical protein